MNCSFRVLQPPFGGYLLGGASKVMGLPVSEVRAEMLRESRVFVSIGRVVDLTAGPRVHC